MSKPTTRVLALLELLQAHGQLSGSELARRLGVDGRTVRRYITVLEELGVPVTTEQGRYGGYSLVAGFKLPPLMFTEDETLAISLGLVSVQGLGLGTGEMTAAVTSAQAKLERVMPSALKGRLRAVTEATRVDLPRAAGLEDKSTLLGLSSAAEQRRRVHFRYEAGDAEATERHFDPYGLVFRRGRWYVVGMCHLRQDMRTFRLDRIVNLRMTDNAFERPKEFDPAEHLKRSLANLPRAMAVEVVLRSDLETAVNYLGESLGVFVIHDDGVLLSTRTDSISWFARQLLRLPMGFRIVHPPELRDAVRQCAEHALRQLE